MDPGLLIGLMRQDFGNGATIFISENVAYGHNASIMEIINGPWNDPDHHHTMYNPSAKYIGAGVAYAGDLVFYTVDTGYWVGDPAPTPDNSSISGTPSSSLMPTRRTSSSFHTAG